ncbi:DNA polymerase III subunit alpha [Terribacillus sp. 7520-G]|uniref:DNA polymerase III subunit alpha n=1 Tax=Terribacillus sp. 7520-G TaxID=2025389 RepID=UPI000BA720C3|nr:DNA polymerase III subunit alpha [Terribacillus sp. 7520-G]PAD37314.1 DNA polymerase III subunit alpha [Terribacillus sp. 7520-G]
MAFTHLQIRSSYSFYQSTIKIPQLVKKAKEAGFDALALTDDSVMYGVVPFYRACLDAGIKPIIGIHAPIEAEGQVVKTLLLAENDIGYQHLAELSTYLQTNKIPHLPLASLQAYANGVIAIIPTHTMIQLQVEPWRSIFGERLYAGISPDEVRYLDDRMLADWQHEHALRFAATGDVRYLQEEDMDAYHCLLAIEEGASWEPAQSSQGLLHHLRTREEMEQLSDSALWKEALLEAGSIAERCTIQLQFDQRHLPAYPVPRGRNAETYLREICEQRLKDLYRDRQDAKERLDYELGVIKDMGFSDYFLIVWDFVRYAKEHGIRVGPGRGSAAGSLVAYVLGITAVDPLAYGLLFERFLNPERISMPDIDIDFSDYRRDEVIRYVHSKYGSDHVAQIITFGTFAARSLLRELIKTMEIPQADAAYLLKMIPHNISSLSAGLRASEELTAYVRDSEQLKRLFRIGVKLEGLPRHVSTHAAGIVISADPLVKTVPLASGHDEVALTQFAMKELEQLGLLKMDFLGLRNLTLMDHVLNGLPKKPDMDAVPLDDEATFRLFREGRTNGVFQFESSGMKQVLRQLKPSAFEDIVAVNALYRPGPMSYIPVFIRRKHGQETISYPHANLTPILEKTYGVLVYQEQIMQIAASMAGYKLGEADLLRRAVSKKDADVLAKEENRFLSGCIENGYSADTAREVFSWIVKFANYGFNRSHAVAYSFLAYQLAYLKAHFPANFFAELMSGVANQPEKIRQYMREAADSGIKVLGPSINKSFGKYTVENKNIRMGLLAIKGIGAQVARAIIQARKDGPFKHLFDFCIRVSLNKSALEQLVLAGAFDDMNDNRAAVLATIDNAMEQAELFKELYEQPSLLGEVEFEAAYAEQEPFSPMKTLRHEKEVLGLYISSHPLASYRGDLRSSGHITIQQLETLPLKKQVRLAAVLLHQRTIRTKKGQPMAFLTLGDETGEMEAVVFPDLHRQVGRFLEEEALLDLTGRLEERNGERQLILQEGRQFREDMLEHSKERLFIRYDDIDEEEVLEIVRECSKQHPGNVPVIVVHKETRKSYQLSEAYHLELNQRTLGELRKRFGKENVAVSGHG